MSQLQQKAGLFSKAVLFGFLALTPTACGPDAGGPQSDAADTGATAPMSFEEFLAQTYKEPWEGGVYIYNGDTPASSIDELKEAHRQMVEQQQGLAINLLSGGVTDNWGASQKLNLRYCIGSSFGTRKTDIVNAMNAAAAAWEQYAQVDFIYASDQDANCTASNTNVVFDVNQVSGQPYSARAFFPSYPRASRNVYVDTSAYTAGDPLPALLMHELGHALGFRHEHTRPEARRCFEDSAWRGITPYDRASIMHYPECNGVGSILSGLTNLDREGAAFIYGTKVMSPPAVPTGCGSIGVNQGLVVDRNVFSCDGRFRLTLQSDGNVVLFQGSTALWHTQTHGQATYDLIMQSDGNLVAYSTLGRALWNSGTQNYPGGTLAIQNDGNLVIYQNGIVRWTSNTGGH